MSARKNIQCLILLCFGAYTPTQYALSWKIHKFKFYPNPKNLNIISAPQCKRQNCSENNLSEKIYNALFYFVLEYIHQLHMLSHVKYRNYIFKRIEKNLNFIWAPQCWKQNFSEYNLSKNIYNALFYPVLYYIHHLNILSHVKYRNSNFTRIEII